jgi:hypothetical protein
MRRRPASAKPEDYVVLAGAVLDKLNYTKYAQNQSLRFKQSEQGNELDLSRAPYTVYSINIIGVYRSNVLEPLDLTSLNISNTKLENLYELKGMELNELNIAGIPFSNRRKNFFLHHLESFKLKKVVLDVDDFPKDTIEALRQEMEVIDAKSEEAPAKKSSKNEPKPVQQKGAESQLIPVLHADV